MACIYFRLEFEGVYLLLRSRIESQSCISSMPESVLKDNRLIPGVTNQDVCTTHLYIDINSPLMIHVESDVYLTSIQKKTGNNLESMPCQKGGPDLQSCTAHGVVLDYWLCTDLLSAVTDKREIQRKYSALEEQLFQLLLGNNSLSRSARAFRF